MFSLACWLALKEECTGYEGTVSHVFPYLAFQFFDSLLLPRVETSSKASELLSVLEHLNGDNGGNLSITVFQLLERFLGDVHW